MEFIKGGHLTGNSYLNLDVWCSGSALLACQARGRGSIPLTFARTS